jgi:siroheme synthase-like protein
MPQVVTKDNNLFPVFLKVEDMRLLIIGGGKIGLEKLNAVLNNSPQTKIRLVGISISDRIKEIAEEKNNLQLFERSYIIDDIGEADLVIAAVNDLNVAKQIKWDAEQKGKLINVADKPGLCDFYLGSIVQKGNIKIAISTNGKSPTIARRLKEVMNTMIPDEMENVLDNMQTIRQGLHEDFDEKVKQLNDITKVLVAKQSVLKEPTKTEGKKWQRIVTWSLLAFFFMILGHAVLSYIPL